MKKVVFLFSFLIFEITLYAQPVTSKALPLNIPHDYKSELKYYETLLRTDKDNIEYNYKIGLCYLLGRIDYGKAIYYLEFVSKQQKVENEVWQKLAQAYQYNFLFEDAIRNYQIFLQKAGKKDIEITNRQIESCKDAKKLCTSQENVTFENLGKQINTEFDEFNPDFPSNKSFLTFSSNRGSREVYDADIYISELKQENWGKAKNAGGSINTPVFSENEGGLSSDGKLMFIYVRDNKEGGTTDIATSSIKSKTFDPPVMLEDNINTSYNESSATISNDGNTLYFVSDRTGGIGKKDIYFVKKLPNGNWGKPRPLSTKINTVYNEDSPYLSPDGKTLYFSSEGHINMGGYDIFKSIWDEMDNEWSEATNLGCPVNTPDDNFNFVISPSNREAYVSAIRPEGFGNYDIYKVIFNNIDPVYSVYSGHLKTGKFENIDSKAVITLIEKKTKVVKGIFKVGEIKQGKYLICAAPGNYELVIEVEGSQTLREQITIMDKGSDTNELLEFNKDFTLIQK